MKRILVTPLIVGMLSVWVVAASAAPNDSPQVNQNQGAAATQAEPVKDKRIITPQMNARERVEAQRAIQKRAAANRNVLINQAAEKEKQQVENTAK